MLAGSTWFNTQQLSDKSNKPHNRRARQRFNHGLPVVSVRVLVSGPEPATRRLSGLLSCLAWLATMLRVRERLVSPSRCKPIILCRMGRLHDLNSKDMIRSPTKNWNELPPG